MLGGLPPPAVAGSIGNQPHHPGVKAAAPIGPELAAMLPASTHGVDGKVVGRALDRPAHLAGGEIEGPFQPGRL